MRLALSALAVAASVALASTAHAGSRAYYVMIVDVSATPHQVGDDPRRDALVGGLLGCPVNALESCAALHVPFGSADYDGEVALIAEPASLTPAVARAALRGGRPGRRAFARALDDANSSVDGVLVYESDASGLTVTVLDDKGMAIEHVHRAVAPTALTQARCDAIVRAILRPIARRFSP